MMTIYFPLKSLERHFFKRMHYPFSPLSLLEVILKGNIEDPEWKLRKVNRRIKYSEKKFSSIQSSTGQRGEKRVEIHTN